MVCFEEGLGGEEWAHSTHRVALNEGGVEECGGGGHFFHKVDTYSGHLVLVSREGEDKGRQRQGEGEIGDGGVDNDDLFPVTLGFGKHSGVSQSSPRGSIDESG